MSRYLFLHACLILALACAGCANQPPPTVPAMVALNTTGDYGFSETAVAPDQYKVTFVSPSLSAHGDPDQDYGLAGERQRVYDLALWRAAQIALEKGYPAFQIQNETRDVDLQIAQPPAPPPYLPAGLRTISGPPCRWNCERPIGYWGDPYFSPVYDDWYRRAHSSGRVATTLTVKMLEQLAAGAQDAAATTDRLRGMYASSTFDVR